MASIKSIIKKSFIGNFLISELHCLECKLIPGIMNDEIAVKKFYKKNSGVELDINNPQTFSEKMSWYKIFVHDPLMVKCSDKVGVREYVISKGYQESLNAVLGVYEKVSDIDINTLPERFVLKAAHGSHMNIIVKDNKNQINWKQAKMLMRSWLHQDIYWSGREWAYKDVPKRIVAEEYIEDDTGELKDYKFFCFNGIARFMIFIGNRYIGNEYINFYDSDMNFMDVRYEKVPNNPTAQIPVDKETFSKMRLMAEDLSKPFQEVRVDFYVVRNKIYIGEMTFYSGGGYNRYIPKEYDEIFGSYWTLKK